MLRLLIFLAPLTGLALTVPQGVRKEGVDSEEMKYGGIESGQSASDATRASLASLWSYSTVTEDRYDHAVHGDQHDLLPYFQDYENTTNITAQLGSTAYLNCRINRLRDKTVSWVRRDGDEIKLLTWGLHTYSNDARFSLNFEHPNNWKLQIKYTQRRDQGNYECQISTHPPKVLPVRLNIVAPVVEIIDERGASVHEKFYKTGSTIELKCTISQMPQAQTFILWRHGDHMLNYDTSRGGISVKTDMSSSVIVSTLFIANAAPSDSGNYTCSLGDVATGSVFVHVLNGEHPAAMQHGSGTKDLCSWPWFSCCPRSPRCSTLDDLLGPTTSPPHHALTKGHITTLFRSKVFTRCS